MPNKKLEHDRLVRGIAKGAGVVLIGTFVGRLLGYLIRVFLARYYGQEVYGFVSTSIAIFSTVTTIGLLGIPNSLARQISSYRIEEKWKKISASVGVAYFVTGAIGIFFAIIIFIFSDSLAIQFFQDPQLTNYLLYFGIGIPFYLLLRISCNVFQGFQQMTAFITFRDVIRQLFILAGLIVMYFINFPVSHLGSAYFISFLLSSVLVFVTIWNISPIRNHGIHLDLSVAKELFKFSWPLMFASVLMRLMNQTDTIMTGYFLDQAMVGIYNAGVPIGELLGVIYNSFTPALIPIMTDYYVSGQREKLQNSFNLSTKWIFLFVFPGFLLLLIIPEFFIQVLFGTEYLAATNVLRLIALGVFFSSMVGPTGNLLIVIGKTKLVLIDFIIAYAVNIFLNIILIPKYGLIGAATATATSVVIHNTITIFQIYYYLKLIAFRTVYLKITLAGLIPGILFWIIKDGLSGWILLVLCIAFTLVFVALNFLFGAISDEDKMIIREIKKRITG
ncbi:MAG: oligosaccharide flippase family protein [Candidatus Marinimicrobia bacterium]|nr:oligosaccharide flippase family protein [Candidatus Neomarinimicrobiota bacterium]